MRDKSMENKEANIKNKENHHNKANDQGHNEKGEGDKHKTCSYTTKSCRKELEKIHNIMIKKRRRKYQEKS